MIKKRAKEWVAGKGYDHGFNGEGDRWVAGRVSERVEGGEGGTEAFCVCFN